MKSYKVLAFFALMLLGLSQGVLAQKLAQDSFESQLYGVSEISHFGVDKTRYEALNPRQREGILRARAVLLDVFKALQRKDGNPIEFLANSLKNRFPTKRAFAESLLDGETSLLGLIVTDFSVTPDDSQVELSFSVVLSSEGMIVTGSKKALLIMEGTSWKLARIS